MTNQETGVALRDQHGGFAGIHAVITAWKRNERGEAVAIQAMQLAFELHENESHFQCMKSRGKEGDDDYQPAKGMITSAGYRSIQRGCGLSVDKPESLRLEDGREVPNPYKEIDRDTGRWMGETLLLIVYGRNLMGELVPSPYQATIRAETVFLEALFAARKRSPAAVMAGLRTTSPADMLPQVLRDFNDRIEKEIADAAYWASKGKGKAKDWLAEKMYSKERAVKEIERVAARVKAGLWAFRPYDPVTGEGFWYDIQSEEVMAIQGRRNGLADLGGRKLWGIVYRNAMRDHPSTPDMYFPLSRATGKAGERVVVVHGTAHASPRDDVDLKRALVELRDLAKRQIIEVKPQTLHAEDVEDPAAEEAEGATRDEQGRALPPEEAARTAAEPEPEGGEAPAAPASDVDERGAVVADILAIEKKLPAETVKKYRDRIGGTLEKASLPQLKAVLNAYRDHEIANE